MDLGGNALSLLLGTRDLVHHRLEEHVASVSVEEVLDPKAHDGNHGEAAVGELFLLVVEPPGVGVVDELRGAEEVAGRVGRVLLDLDAQELEEADEHEDLRMPNNNDALEASLQHIQRQATEGFLARLVSTGGLVHQPVVTWKAPAGGSSWRDLMGSSGCEMWQSLASGWKVGVTNQWRHAAMAWRPCLSSASRYEVIWHTHTHTHRTQAQNQGGPCQVNLLPVVILQRFSAKRELLQASPPTCSRVLPLERPSGSK